MCPRRFSGGITSLDFLDSWLGRGSCFYTEVGLAGDEVHPGDVGQGFDGTVRG